jgi:hypothetical protein
VKSDQLHLPGIPERPSAAEVKAHVAARLNGFELRQQERARLRAGRRKQREEGGQPEQQRLFSD